MPLLILFKIYDKYSFRKPPRQPATTQAHWGETVAGKFTMVRLGREEKASMVYKDDPILFYKWWIDNPNVVQVSFKEKMELINKVYFQNKKILISEHRRLIEG